MNKTTINNWARKRINTKNQKALQNKDFSLIASNCNGSLILHDLGLRFNSCQLNNLNYPINSAKPVKMWYNKCKENG